MLGIALLVNPVQLESHFQYNTAKLLGRISFHASSNDFEKLLRCLPFNFKFFLIGLNKSSCQEPFKTVLLFQNSNYFKSYHSFITVLLITTSNKSKSIILFTSTNNTYYNPIITV